MSLRSKVTVRLCGACLGTIRVTSWPAAAWISRYDSGMPKQGEHVRYSGGADYQNQGHCHNEEYTCTAELFQIAHHCQTAGRNSPKLPVHPFSNATCLVSCPAANGICAAVRGHTDSVNDVCWQPFSGNICSASADNSICMWDARSGLAVLKLYGHESTCNCATFDPQARHPMNHTCCAESSTVNDEHSAGIAPNS